MHEEIPETGFRRPLGWTCFWVALALAFNLGVWHFMGREKGLEFFTGWLLEYSLSVDNLFVFALIFSYFQVPVQWQRKVLFWGIAGAVVMRMGIILLGVTLVSRFAWVLYLFGVFLIFTGIKMLVQKGEAVDPGHNPVLRLVSRFVPMTPQFEGDRFFVLREGRRMATPLLAVLVCVEVSDILFAVDSIPAIFGVTLDPFIIYTSNVFAILGLRSLYFVLARALHVFHYLKPGLALVLGFIGVKIFLDHTAWAVGTPVALGVVAGVLGLAVAASLLFPRERA